MRNWDKQKLRALGRHLLIVLLVVTAGLLTRETGYFPARARRSEQHISGAQASASGAKPAGAVQPLAAVVCGADGGRFGAAYDEAGVMAVFHRFSADVGEALGSAGTPAFIEDQALQQALLRCGLTLRFYSPQPLELLSGWLGTEMSGPAAQYRADLLCLFCTEDGSALLCFRSETGEAYCCATNVSAETLQNRTAEYTPNGAYYAFEHPLLAGGDDCTVLLDGSMSAAVAQCSAVLPAGMGTDELLGLFGMNGYAARSYSEADGTVVFVDDECTLRQDAAGSLFFHRATSPEPVSEMSATSAVNEAWLLAEQSIGKSCGDAALLLEDMRELQNQRSYTVTLDYAVNGIPVRLAAGHAAEITIRDGAVVRARLEFRHFSLTEERQILLPCLQACAVAAAEQSAAELVYVDGGETMNCVWVRSDG